MIESEYIESLGFMIVLAAVLLLLTRWMKLPSIVVYLCAGLLVGPVAGLVEIGSGIQLISELGIVLLLFVVGLELSLDKVRDVGKVVIVAGLGQVIFTGLGGFVLCTLLDFKPVEAVFLATGLTFSSTVVVVKLLNDKKDLDQLYGRIALGILLVQDLVVIAGLTLLNGLAGTEQLNVSGIALGLAKAMGGMAVLLTFTLFASKKLLPRPFSWASRFPDTLFIWSLCWCLLVVAGAHFLHLSVEVGAFLAGLALAQLPYNRDLRRRVHPLMDFFVAVFFVSLGAQMELGASVQYSTQIVGLTLFVFVSKALLHFGLILLMKFRKETAFLSGVTLMQVSEFSFVFVAMGVSAGLIEPRIFSIMALVGVLTIVVSSYLILKNRALFHWSNRLGLLRWFPSGQDPEEKDQQARRGHILLVGMNSLGRSLARRLHDKGEVVVAIDTDPHKLEGLPCETLYGNVAYASLLEEAGLSRAKLLISALQIEDVNEFLAYICRTHGVRSCITAVDMNGVDGLLEMDVSYLIFPRVDGIKRQNALLADMGILKP